MFKESVNDYSATATNTSFLVYMAVILPLISCYAGICLSLSYSSDLYYGRRPTTTTKVNPSTTASTTILSDSAGTTKREAQ